LIEEIEVKPVLNKHRKRDEWFLDDYSVNLYYGCNFGCVYCYIRGSKYGKGGIAQAKINSPKLAESLCYPSQLLNQHLAITSRSFLVNFSQLLRSCRDLLKFQLQLLHILFCTPPS